METIDAISSSESSDDTQSSSSVPPPDANVVLDMGGGPYRAASGHGRRSWEATARHCISMSQKRRGAWAKSQDTKSRLAPPVKFSSSPAATPSRVLHRSSCSRASTRAPTPAQTDRSGTPAFTERSCTPVMSATPAPTDRSSTPALTDRPGTPVSHSVPRPKRSPSPMQHAVVEILAPEAHEQPESDKQSEWLPACPQLGVAIPPPSARRPKSAGDCTSVRRAAQSGCSRSMFAWRSARQADSTIGRLLSPPAPPTLASLESSHASSQSASRPATPTGMDSRCATPIQA